MGVQPWPTLVYVDPEASRVPSLLPPAQAPGSAAMITPFSGAYTVLKNPTCSNVAGHMGTAGRTGQFNNCTLRDEGKIWSVSLPVWATVNRAVKNQPEVHEQCVLAAVLAEDAEGSGWKRRPLLMFPNRVGPQRWSSTMGSLSCLRSIGGDQYKSLFSGSLQTRDIETGI